MKKCILIVILVFFLTGCNKSAARSYTEVMEVDGQSLTVRFDEGAWSAGTIGTENGEYTFEYTAPGSLTIVYPDGYVYTQNEVHGAIATPADYSADAVRSKGYIDGLSLSWTIESAAANARGTRGGPASVPLAVVLLGVGLWNLLAPKSAWWLARGWWYKDAEPSALALGAHCLAGVVLLLAGVLCLLASF